MSERKVLNKYYPPDFDPAKIPKLHLERNRQYSIRIMAPFNMRCNTCGEYIYKGKKFNSRKETVETENYLGLYIFRFYIKCPRCVAEIAFKTDPERTDYALEDGATRNFEPQRTAEELAKREREAIEAEEKNNPMKVLENRTKASQREMEALEELEELRDMNSRNAKLDHNMLIKKTTAYKELLRKLQDDEDEAFIQSVFGKKDDQYLRRLEDEPEDAVPRKKMKTDTPSDILTEESTTSNMSKVKQKNEVWNRSVGGLSNKSSLGNLVKKKPLLVKKKDVTKDSATEVKNEQNQIDKDKVNEQHKRELDSNMAQDLNKIKNDDGESTDKHMKTTEQDKAMSQTVQNKPAISAPSGLSLLGGYSDSESNSSESD